MESTNELEVKTLVKEKYSQIALQSAEENRSGCCGVGGFCDSTYTVFSEDYSALEGYNPEADLGLGCGIPTQFARIQKGDTVLDLGSGAGNDVFVAQRLAGIEGKVIGVDMTEIMIEKARANAEQLGINNVEFRLGEIEHLPVGAGRVDVVLSNCVLNLVPNKQQAFNEIFRVLKQGGHFCISDVVLGMELPPKLKHDAELYAGCVAGAILKSEYLEIISAVGFSNVQVVKERIIDIPDEILMNYFTTSEVKEFKEQKGIILSITVTADKTSCCVPGSCC